jgi:hypothetical protein
MPSNLSAPRLCERCGDPFMARVRAIRNGNGRFCSIRCAGVARPISHVTGLPPKRRGQSKPGRYKPVRRPTLEERFWSKVDRSNPDGCWPWVGRTENGYGLFDRPNGDGTWRSPKSHAVAWLLTHGPVPAGREVCHDCPGGDNPRCVRPSHLYAGTHAENMQDASRKGQLSTGDEHYLRRNPDRRIYGERNAAATLTAEQVRSIRLLAAQGWGAVSLGKQFGVSHSTISVIVHRKSWAHLD